MAYATSVKNLELKTKARYTPSELKTSADPILYDIGALIFYLATGIKTEMAKFGLGDPEFAEMERMLGGFKQAIPQRRIAATISKTSTGNIGDVFTTMDQLLKDEVDVLMMPFQFSEADFYKAYKNARIIVDYKGGGKKEEAPAAV